MNWKTHLAFGLFAGLVSFRFFNMNWWQTSLFFVIVLVGSLLPDIDKPESKVGRKVGVISKIINLLFGHRGITHSLWLWFGVFFILWISFRTTSWVWVAWAYFVGYGSHLISDSLTLMGINWFHPFKFFRSHGMIETGKTGETIVFFGMILANAIFVVHLFGVF